MTRADMDRVRGEFVRAVEMSITCGFDMLELHCAHGYLLSSFITPLANRRTDEYGGSLENRLRYPLEIFRAMRAAWPGEKPISVRISATDWVAGGIGGPESVEIARAFAEAGADAIHVSTGQTSPDAKPVYGRAYQTPFSDRIRNEVGVADDRGGQHHRGRPGERHRRRGARGPVRAGPPAPGRRRVDAARRRRAGPRRAVVAAAVPHRQAATGAEPGEEGGDCRGWDLMVRLTPAPVDKPLSARIREMAVFAGGAVLVVDWIGAVLVWVGVLPAALGSLHVPLLLMLAAAGGVWALAYAGGVLGQPLPMRCLQASLSIGGAACFATMVADLTGLCTGRQAWRAMIFASVGLAGAGLVGDAVRDARKQDSPRFAALACWCGVMAMVMLGAWLLAFRNPTGVWNRCC